MINFKIMSDSIKFNNKLSNIDIRTKFSRWVEEQGLAVPELALEYIEGIVLTNGIYVNTEFGNITDKKDFATGYKLICNFFKELSFSLNQPLVIDFLFGHGYRTFTYDDGTGEEIRSYERIAPVVMIFLPVDQEFKAIQISVAIRDNSFRCVFVSASIDGYQYIEYFNEVANRVPEIKQILANLSTSQSASRTINLLLYNPETSSFIDLISDES